MVRQLFASGLMLLPHNAYAYGVSDLVNPLGGVLIWAALIIAALGWIVYAIKYPKKTALRVTAILVYATAIFGSIILATWVSDGNAFAILVGLVAGFTVGNRFLDWFTKRLDPEFGEPG